MPVSSMKAFFLRFRAQAGLLALLALCAAPALWSCTKPADTTAYDAAVKAAQAHQDSFKIIDDTIILGYMKRHGYTAANYQRTASGLYLVTINTGTGAAVAVGQNLTVRYTGKFVSAAKENTVFDTSVHAATPTAPATGGYSFVFNPSAFVLGWSEGLLLMHQGDRKLLLLPSYLAYGPAGAGTAIPPNTPILFDLEVLSIAP